MEETTRVELELDDRCLSALEAEAQRLNVSVPDIICRAAAAWVTEMADNPTGNGMIAEA